MWPDILSDRLPVIGLVSRYLTNYLIGREPLHKRIAPFTLPSPSRIIPSFPGLSASHGQVAHVLLTRAPLVTFKQAYQSPVRLACLIHAASVRSEPESNSP